MNKSEIIKNIVKTHHYNHKDIDRVINAFIEVTSIALSKGHKVSIMGFGKFAISKRTETETRNPGTGKKFIIHAHNRIIFKPGKYLKNSCNK